MDKVLVNLYVPMIEKSYSVWLPINKSIFCIISLLTKAVKDINKGNYEIMKFPRLYNKNTAETYMMNMIVKDTDIRNGTELILI